MYNVFKRPMFKLGGQADQGTGIMSTVEPKQTMRQNPYTGYAIGGRIGYAQAGQVTDPFTYFSPSNIPKAGFAIDSSNQLSGTDLLRQAQQKFDEEQRAIQQANREKFGITSPEIKRGYGFLETDAQKVLREKGLSTQLTAAERAKIESGLKAARETEEKINLYGPSEDVAVENIILKGEEKPKVNPPKYTETKTSEFNLLDEVKKESQELRALLGQDDDISKAEAALVLSEALGTPGTIAQKIQRGLKAAVPLKKAKREEDKAITLTAYKLAKEKEQQQIRAGTLPTSIREAEYIARSLKESGDPRYANMSVQQIMNENISAAKPMSPESKARTEVLLADRQIIRDATNSLLQDKNNLDRLDPIKDKAKYDKTKELYDKKFREFERDYLSAPEFKSLYEGIYNIFVPQTTSRTMRAAGGPTEDETESDVVASNVNFGGTTTPIKPVQKLDYATLRDRLPKEINDQVVQLLASSEQALQDFAYITSQNDVNNFNVKYGVNLIIPPAQQTS